MKLILHMGATWLDKGTANNIFHFYYAQLGTEILSFFKTVTMFHVVWVWGIFICKHS